MYVNEKNAAMFAVNLAPLYNFGFNPNCCLSAIRLDGFFVECGVK